MGRAERGLAYSLHALGRDSGMQLANADVPSQRSIDDAIVSYCCPRWALVVPIYTPCSTMGTYQP
jgi:hypothetical protein